MKAREQVERTNAALAQHWNLSRPWPASGPVADRLLLCDTGGVHDDPALFELAECGTDDEVAAAASALRS